MATVLDIVDVVKALMREPDEIEVSIAQIQTMINEAALEARNAGWLLFLEDDESLTFLDNTYEYSVPASFAYITELRVEDDTTTPSTWNELIEQHLWSIRIDAAVPKFFFHRYYPLPVGKQLKVVGQKRPSTYSTLAATIDSGTESFIRARTLASALGFVASSMPEIDQQRFLMYDRYRRDAEILLARHPMELRVRPSSRYVLGR